MWRTNLSDIHGHLAALQACIAAELNGGRAEGLDPGT